MGAASFWKEAASLWLEITGSSSPGDVFGSGKLLGTSQCASTESSPGCAGRGLLTQACPAPPSSEEPSLGHHTASAVQPGLGSCLRGSSSPLTAPALAPCENSCAARGSIVHTSYVFILLT